MSRILSKEQQEIRDLIDVFIRKILEKLDKADEELQRYQELEKEKKLINLPCSIGSELWDISKGFLIPFGFHTTDGENFIEMSDNPFGGKYITKYAISEYGKTIFPDKETAKNKLEENEVK